MTDQEFMIEFSEYFPQNSLAYRIKLLSHHWTRRMQEVLAPFGLTPMSWGVLCCLWKEDNVPSTTIREQLGALGGTLTPILDGMERQGLVRRERDSEDRRIWRVSLTDRSSRLRYDVFPKVRELARHIYAPLSDEEMKVLTSLIERLSTSSEES